MHCPGLEFRLIPKLISWAGLRIGSSYSQAGLSSSIIFSMSRFIDVVSFIRGCNVATLQIACHLARIKKFSEKVSLELWFLNWRGHKVHKRGLRDDKLSSAC